MINKIIKYGFTLVELLVVISIIAILLAVLLPALGKAKKSAQKVVCMTRLDQLFLGGMAYAQNNNNKFPHQYADRINDHMLVSNPLTTTDPCEQDNWVRHIFPYIKTREHLRCPANNVIINENRPTRENDISYTCNGVISHLGGANMKRTSKTVVYCDNPGKGNASVVRPFYNSVSAAEVAKITTGKHWTGWMRYADGSLHPQEGHNGKCFSFLDGHVQYAKWQDVTSMWYGLHIGVKPKDGQEPQVSGYDDERRNGLIKW
jgi:prepilin-type N-terminal cleavage/methylation domain-containing protein